MLRHLAIFVVLFAISYSQARLNIEVLYESLCPDSLNFVKNQLYPTWKDVAQYVNIKFVPFGKSSSYRDGTFFKCQHGPKECEGNRVMSCALAAIHDQTLQVEYVNCFMKVFKHASFDNEEFGQKCAIDVGLDWEYIRQCYETTDGTLLQLKAEQDTKRIHPRFIPTILFEGIFDQKLQDASLIDFKGVTCELLQKKFEIECN